MRARFVTICAAFVLTGCAHPENYRWAKASQPDFSQPAPKPVETKFDWGPGPSVSVYTVPTPSAAPTSLSVAGLSDRGQAAWIKTLSMSKVDPVKIGGVLSKPIGQKDDSVGGAATRVESFSRTLVATVAEGLEAGPADRMVWTWIDIRPVNFVFDGYTVAATDNELLNIETVQNQTTASLQGQLGLTTSNTNAATNSTAPPSSTGGTTVGDVLTKVLGTSAGATGNLSNQYTTSATVSQQYEKLHVDILPEELRIFRGSERNLDVTGNTLIALTMRVDPSRWTGAENPMMAAATEEVADRVSKLVVADKGKVRTPRKVDLEVSLEKSPPGCPLKADVTLIYELRKVRDARSYVEGEQEVEYIRDNKKFEGLTMIRADEVRKPSWRVRAKGERKDSFAYLIEPFGDPLPLDFSSFEQAKSFALWLNRNHAWLNAPREHKIGADGAQLSWSGEPGDEAFPSGEFFADRFSDEQPEAVCSTMRTRGGAKAVAGSPPSH